MSRSVAPRRNCNHLAKAIAKSRRPDAGVSDGNFDYVVTADFESVEDYQAYATNTDHVALVTNVIKPAISAHTQIGGDGVAQDGRDQ